MFDVEKHTITKCNLIVKITQPDPSVTLYCSLETLEGAKCSNFPEQEHGGPVFELIIDDIRSS
jgi:hypothetical protein